MARASLMISASSARRASCHHEIERGEQQDVEIAVGDMRSLMREHCKALLGVPAEKLRRHEDGRAEGDGTADVAADAHVRTDNAFHRLCRTHQTPRQAETDG